MGLPRGAYEVLVLAQNARWLDELDLERLTVSAELVVRNCATKLGRERNWSLNLWKLQHLKARMLEVEGLPKNPMLEAGVSSNAPDASVSTPISFASVILALRCPILEVLLIAGDDGPASEIWVMYSASSGIRAFNCASSSAILRTRYSLDLRDLSKFVM